MDGKRAFITEHTDDIDKSNFLTIPKGDYKYINKPISENGNMNNRKIINCKEGKDETDVCTIKNLTVYY